MPSISDPLEGRPVYTVTDAVLSDPQLTAVRIQSIIEALHLKDPIFKATAAYGHFGRESREVKCAKGRTVRLFPWEQTNRAEELKTAAGV